MRVSKKAVVPNRDNGNKKAFAASPEGFSQILLRSTERFK
jgi:hypothetical protein